MIQRIETLAVLFADICDSTALYDSLGDDMARRLISRCIAMMANEIPTHRGRLIKTIGDEIMCVFPSASAALHSACAMQTAIDNDGVNNDQPMRVRIGFHYGDVIREGNDVFGDTVNVAARVAAITRGNQIMTTHAVVQELPPELQSIARQVLRTEFKGKQEQLDIYQVEWEPDELMRTRITSAFQQPQEHQTELALNYGSRSFILNKDRRLLVVGRTEPCHVVVNSDFASRQHARIELRFGKFVITDESTNGTYVRFSDGNEIRIAREELILQGSGSISLGESHSKNPTGLVEFSISAGG